MIKIESKLKLKWEKTKQKNKQNTAEAQPKVSQKFKTTLKYYSPTVTMVHFMSASSSSCSSSFPFQSSEFGSSSISNRLAQVL